MPSSPEGVPRSSAEAARTRRIASRVVKLRECALENAAGHSDRDADVMSAVALAGCARGQLDRLAIGPHKRPDVGG